MNVNESPDNEELDELPPDIRAVLAEEAKVEPFISATQDEAILVAARAELGSSKIVVHPLLRTGRWVAVAAAIVLGFVLQQSQREQPQQSSSEAPTADFNRDSAIDILDVMFLAQRIEANSDVPPHGDFNQDGVIDQTDVDVFAANLVRLDNPI